MNDLSIDLFCRDGTTLAVINVYCPRVDRDKPERLTYKLNFYAALEKRARSFLARGWSVVRWFEISSISFSTSRVIILGDFNVSHRPIDTCDPGEDLEVNLSQPSERQKKSILPSSISTPVHRVYGFPHWFLRGFSSIPTVTYTLINAKLILAGKHWQALEWITTVFELITSSVMGMSRNRVWSIVKFARRLNRVIIVQWWRSLITRWRIEYRRNHHRFVRSFGRNLKEHRWNWISSWWKLNDCVKRKAQWTKGGRNQWITSVFRLFFIW